VDCHAGAADALLPRRQYGCQQCLRPQKHLHRHTTITCQLKEASFSREDREENLHRSDIDTVLKEDAVCHNKDVRTTFTKKYMLIRTVENVMVKQGTMYHRSCVDAPVCAIAFLALPKAWTIDIWLSFRCTPSLRTGNV
jgi:hypothetical protein